MTENDPTPTSLDIHFADHVNDSDHVTDPSRCIARYKFDVMGLHPGLAANPRLTRIGCILEVHELITLSKTSLNGKYIAILTTKAVTKPGGAICNSPDDAIRDAFTRLKI